MMCETVRYERHEANEVDYMDENEEYFQRQASHRQSRRRFRKINQKGERQTIIDTVDPYPPGKPPPAGRSYHTVSPGPAPSPPHPKRLGSTPWFYWLMVLFVCWWFYLLVVLPADGSVLCAGCSTCWWFYLLVVLPADGSVLCAGGSTCWWFYLLMVLSCVLVVPPAGGSTY
ncbi:hypothetical protein NHX12_010792 [Muraenolepis orangiensis]|uniref:Uncharacterized protein n=1 Tax=Muraenolepis orangiensis TaxID=630683 RepID=A0A9Q0DE14_9TELE|nr:hypothetical protein NHX12_010792 [Muraenolepis orangiensis]